MVRDVRPVDSRGLEVKYNGAFLYLETMFRVVNMQLRKVLLNLLVVTGLLPCAAFAIDMKGDWSIVTDWQGGKYPQAWKVTTQAAPDGPFSGISTSSVGGSKFGDIFGSISGRSFTLTNPYTSLNYTGDFIGTVSEDGDHVTGTWTSTWSQSGTFVGTRVSKPLSVDGKVLNREQDPVAGITITLTGKTKNGDDVSKTATTGSDGKYSFEVESGTYSVEATGEGDYDDKGVTKKENGGVLSAESDVGASCGGTAQKNICHLDPVENASGKADFVYTLCAAEERSPNGKPLTHCPIILVPGFLGSRIVCEGGATELWPGLPLPGWGKMYLEADGETNVSNNGSCNISANAVPGADGVLTTVAGADIYQGAITFLEDEAAGRWWAAAYDWRKSPVIGANRLGLAVDDALQATGSKYVVLYGHSMGGLVIREFVNNTSNADKVVRIMTAGTPYWGAPKSHFALLGGYVDTPAGTALDHVTWANELQILARNLQGLFYLYPSSKFGSWLAVSRQTFGPFIVQSEGGEDDWVESLGANARLLQNARSWHQLNDGFPQTDIDYHAVVGAGSATVLQDRIRISAAGQQAFGNIDFGNGDGTVPLRSATQGASETGTPLGKAVPIHYACGVGHVALPGNSQVLTNIRQFLLAGEEVTGLTDKCEYSGVAVLVAELKLGGGNTDVTVFSSSSATLPARHSAKAVAAAGSGAMSLDDAVDLGLVQYFPVANTGVIVTDDRHPVTLEIKGKNLGVQVQKIGSNSSGPLESYKIVKGSLLIDPATQTISSNGKALGKVKVSNKAPKTTGKVSKKGASFLVTLSAKAPNGVLGTFYRIGKKGKEKRYGRPFKVSGKALGGVRFYSVDLFGQAEKWRGVKK